ncbi:MAG: hypothetical protein NVS3B21_18420 [Acidimicrobiales bacterium]
MPASRDLALHATIPDFEPSPDFPRRSDQSLRQGQSVLAASGLHDDTDFDLWTALVSGLCRQRLASVLPFPTAQLAFAMGHGTPADKLNSLALYAVVSSVMGMTWPILFSYLVRHQELIEGRFPMVSSVPNANGPSPG